jgi:hypothetical protein
MDLDTTPDPTDPFPDQTPSNYHVPRRITYGRALYMDKYSNSLRDLIQECLYEAPKHRTPIDRLKRKIHEGMQACVLAGCIAEPWKDFLPAEPLPPDVVNPPALPVLQANPTAAQTLAHKKVLREAKKQARLRAAKDAAKQLLPKHKRERLFVQRYRNFDRDDKQCGNKFKTDGTQIYCIEHGG